MYLPRILHGEIIYPFFFNAVSTAGPSDGYGNLIDGVTVCDNFTLPVDLTSFTTNCENENVVLQWSTASESGCDYFSVEKSSNGINWVEFDRVNGAGISDQPHFYSIKDYPASENSNPVTYYRLKQTDFNGAFKYYGPVTSECFINHEWNLQVENITTENLWQGNIYVDEETKAFLEISDVSGKRLLLQNLLLEKGNNKLIADITGIQSGIYIARIYNSKNQTAQKFLLNNSK